MKLDAYIPKNMLQINLGKIGEASYIYKDLKEHAPINLEKEKEKQHV